QVRMVGEYPLDIGLEPGQLRFGCLRRVVRVAVPRLDLAPRADRIQHLGDRGGQRDDRRRPRTDVHGPVGGRDFRGEAVRRGGGAASGGAARGGVARGGLSTATGREKRDGRHGRQTAGANQQAAGAKPHDHPPSGRGGRSAPAATPGGNRNEPPFLRGRRIGAGHAAGLVPPGSSTGRHHRSGTAPGSQRLRLALHHPGRTRDRRTLSQPCGRPTLWQGTGCHKHGDGADVAEPDGELVIPEGGFWPAPEVPQPNIYPMEWRVETDKLAAIYEKSKLATWNPANLPWDALRAEDFSTEQRLGIMYWFSVLANFDASGPAVFARATIHAFEQHEEDPVRKCFFSITRDEMNHEECCQRTIAKLWPGGPLDWQPSTPLEQAAHN